MNERVTNANTSEQEPVLSTHDVDMNFADDLVSIFRHRLAEAGYAMLATATADDVLYKWSHFCNRVPVARPRRVHRSREFLGQLSLPPDLQDGLALVEKKLVAGETIFPHLSRRISDLDYHDILLDDWGIHHLHLGTRTDAKKKQLLEGTREVLYCIFRDSDVYFINVMSHEFNDPVVLSIVSSNWPHLVAPLPLYPATTASGNVVASTLSSVKESRAAKVFPGGGPRCTTLVTMPDGRVLMPPGGGFAISGHSVGAGMRARQWMDSVEQWEGIARESVDELVASAKERGVEAPSRLRFELWYDGENGYGWCAHAHELQINLVLPTEYAPVGLVR